MSKGILPIGVEFEGELHREFEVHRVKVRDNMTAMEKYPEAHKNERYAGLAAYAECIDKLGTIPKEKITPELLLDMDMEDFDALTKAMKFRGTGS